MYGRREGDGLTCLDSSSIDYVQHFPSNYQTNVLLSVACLMAEIG